MGEWGKSLEAKAKIIRGQMAEARKLALEAGLDPDDVSRPYLDLTTISIGMNARLPSPHNKAKCHSVRGDAHAWPLMRRL